MPLNLQIHCHAQDARRMSRTSDFNFDLSEELIQRIREFDECLVLSLLDLYSQ